MGSRYDRKLVSRILLLMTLVMLLTAVGTVVLMGMAAKPRAAEKRHAAEAKPVPVDVVTALPTNVRDVVELPGVLVPWHDVRVSAEAAGRVVELCVEEGDRVAAGGRLLEVDNRLHTQNVKRAEIALLDARADLERWTTLRKTGSVTDKEFADMTSRAQQADVALAEARVLLDQCTLAAPVEGVVDERYVEVGEYVHVGDPVVRIVGPRRMKVRVNVSERDVVFIEKEQMMTFAVDALTNRVLGGRVVFVSRVADEASNTFRVELEVANDDGALRGGMIARVNVSRGVLQGVIALPVGALIPEKGQYVIFVVEDGVAVRRIARLRAIAGLTAIIETGVDAGDRVVVAGQRQLADGAPVELTGGEAARER